MNGITRMMLGTALAAAACQGGGGDRETAAADTAAATAARDSAAAVNSKELKVDAVMIGRQIGGGGLIIDPTFQFAPTDTVFVSVRTEGSPASAALTAVWQGQGGKNVDSVTQTITPKGRTNTAFRAAPEKGWKPGTYRVVVYADGDSVDAKTFAVKK